MTNAYFCRAGCPCQGLPFVRLEGSGWPAEVRQGRLGRPAGLTFNAGPEPVTFGRKLTLKGRLTIKRNGRWAPLRHGKVGVYFPAPGKSATSAMPSPPPPTAPPTM